MTEGWAPLRMDRYELAVLHEGIQPWMKTRFFQWVDKVAEDLQRARHVSGEMIAAEFDERARMTTPLAPRARRFALSAVIGERNDELLALRFADFLLWKFASAGNRGHALEEVLATSGSAWRVGTREGAIGLERRVPVGVQEAADAVTVSAGIAGQILSQAWHALYGISPDYDVAYKKAILAVEAAGGQQVTPNDKVGTLGKMTSAMRDQGWALPLTDDPKHPSSNVLWKMAKAMVAGEQSRHAVNGTYTPATPEDAESAVYLAVALVQFFHAGLAAKR